MWFWLFKGIILSLPFMLNHPPHEKIWDYNAWNLIIVNWKKNMRNHSFCIFIFYNEIIRMNNPALVIHLWYLYHIRFTELTSGRCLKFEYKNLNTEKNPKKTGMNIILYEWRIVWSQQNYIHKTPMLPFFENNYITASHIKNSTREMTMKQNSKLCPNYH